MRRLVVVCVLVMVAGCKAPASADAGVSEEENAAALAQLIARFGTREHVDGLSLDLVRVRAALRSGRMRFNPAVLSTCLQAGYATPFIEQVPQVPGCKGLWEGLTPHGQPCDTSFACRDGTCGQRTSQCGVCVPFKKQGEACTVVDRCEGELQCTSGKCAPLPALGNQGQPCPCVKGLNCDPSSRCVQPSPTGASCSDHSMCSRPDLCLEPTRTTVSVCGQVPVGGACSQDVFCVRGAACAGGVCASSGDGGPCGLNGDRCADGFACSTRGLNRTCVPRRAANEACVFSSQCPLGFSCAEGHCRRVMGPGAACDDPTTTCMEWTTCVNGRCSRRPQSGEACLGWCAYSDCVAGTCVSRPTGTPCENLEGGSSSCGRGRVCLNSVCAVSSSAEPDCVLGDGAARDDFGGPAMRPVVDAGCVWSGPEAEVVPLTDTQGRCAFGSATGCEGCHRNGGCWELRPRTIPPDNHFSLVNPACGIDAGR